MMQISYQPAFDPYYAVYRLLRLRQVVLINQKLHRDHLKILDFYLQFPFRIDDLRLQQSDRKYRRLAKEYLRSKPYGDLPDDRILFNRMSPIQSAALDTLAVKGLIDRNLYDSGTVKSADTHIPPHLLERINADNAEQSGLMSFLITLATDYELLGSNGLKDRSGLMDHRYDAV